MLDGCSWQTGQRILQVDISLQFKIPSQSDIMFINPSGDWLLRFLYRTLSMTSGVAGMMPIDCERIENIDLSTVVGGHSEYPQKMPELLKFVGITTKNALSLDAEGGLKKSNSEMPYTEKVWTQITLV